LSFQTRTKRSERSSERVRLRNARAASTPPRVKSCVANGAGMLNRKRGFKNRALVGRALRLLSVERPTIVGLDERPALLRESARYVIIVYIGDRAPHFIWVIKKYSPAAATGPHGMAFWPQVPRP